MTQPAEERKMTRRRFADVCAVLTAIGVLVVGLVLVLGPSYRHFNSQVWDRDPFSRRLVTTTETKRTVPGRTSAPATTKTTKTTTLDEDGDIAKTTVIETTSATSSQVKPSTEVTATKNEADDSFLERALGPGGLIVFRFAIVAFAAFIAGAVVQRTVMGQFAIKLGVLELGELQAATTDSVAELKKTTDSLAATQARLARLVGSKEKKTRATMEALSAQVKELEKRLPKT
jgi:hypothetical protein